MSSFRMIRLPCLLKGEMLEGDPAVAKFCKSTNAIVAETGGRFSSFTVRGSSHKLTVAASCQFEDILVAVLSASPSSYYPGLFDYEIAVKKAPIPVRPL